MTARYRTTMLDPEHTRRRRVSADELERIAWEHPSATITLSESRAYLTLDGLTYVAVLPPAGEGRHAW